MTFQTPLTDLFGMKHPIIVGGMMWLSTGPFAAACARTGTLAFVTPRSYRTLDAFETDLAEAVAAADGGPLGVNITLSDNSTNGSVPDWVDIALRVGVRSFETAGRLPVEALDRLKSGGGRVIHKCTSVRHAIAAEKAGVDAIALVGMEAGGHPGQNPHPAHVLASRARSELTVPIALGGAIGTGAQILSVLALGAGAAVVGTRLLTASEIWAHQNYKARLAATDIDGTGTALGRFAGTWRVLDNDTLRQVQDIEARPETQFTDFGEIVRGRYGREHAYVQGDVEKGMLSCSAAVGFANRVQPVDEIISGLSTELEEAWASLNRFRPG